MTDVDLHKLLTLLDDPDEKIAVNVMSELLKHEKELLPLLGELQESADPLERKRIQQLETIICMRERRRKFLEIIESEQVDVIHGLIELHRLWFDRDSEDLLMEMLGTFMGVAANNKISNLEELGSFMARNGFALPPPEERFDPENFCIGPILEDRLGADVMLCTLALLAGIDAGLQLGLVRINGKFAVVNITGEMIAPDNNWLIDRSNKLRQGDFWNEPKAVLKYAAMMLFLFAVSSDNFRYVHTIAHALCGTAGDEMLDFLPYPYNGKISEEESI